MPGYREARCSNKAHVSQAYYGYLHDAIERALEMVSAGEALITFGAGNVWMAGEEMLERLRHANPDTAAPSSSDVSAPAPKQEGQS